MNNNGDRTSRGYQDILLACIEKESVANGFCTATTKILAQKSGTTRNVTKKGLQDLVRRGLLRRELDRDEATGYITERRLYPKRNMRTTKQGPHE